MRHKGFTLIELMVTVTIIALLSAMVISGFTKQQRRARDARRVADGGSLGVAIESYKAANSQYPNSTVAGTYGYPNSNNLTINNISGSHQDGTIVDKNLGVLVDQGLINNLPKDPKPTDITSVTELNSPPTYGPSGNPPFCLSYTYKKDDTNVMGNDNLNYIWGFIHGENIGPRAWVIRIATEIEQTDGTLNHPLDNSIPAQTAHAWCNSTRGYAYILGPKQ